MEYKINKYLYIVPKINTIVLYNLVTNNIFAITEDRYALLNSKREKLSELKEERPAFFSAMEKLGVIVPQSFDELDYVKMMNKKVVFSNSEYRLTINPTLECNFNCWYCYEGHQEGRMLQDVMEAVVNHIKLKIEDKSLRFLQLDWFGGEPLLYFDEVVYPLSKQIKQLVDEKQIPFSNSATTNGYLINKERIDKFREIGLNHFQITLDGNEATHNKIRFEKNKEGSFKKIIENINLLAENAYFSVLLRINYTQKTLKDINEIIDLFSEKAKEKITVLFQQVWQDAIKEYVSVEENKAEFEKRGFKIKKYETNSNFYVCYADKEQQAVINYDGKVHKCTARDFTEKNELGVLQQNGEIQWNIPKLSKRLAKATFENKYCLECNLLPVCMGPCSQKVFEFPEQFDYHFFRKFCLQDGIRMILDENVENHYNKLLKLENNV